ncbi:MAG: zinc ABC transporter substrate-binding protein [Oscillospiraceae bacterium]|jgi:zinc transport system substrate-binding protein|nr:zinc ABC transporter substrate-binding protein [Oscillospiraceae bacterium]
MKKLIATVLAASAIFALAACGVKTQETDDGKLHIVVTTDALYELANIAGGDRVSVVNIANGAEPHDFEPKPKDIEAIQEADLFIYNGLGIDVWAEGVDAPNSLAAAEIGDNAIDGDPHMWLSPSGAFLMIESISEMLVELEPESKDYFVEKFAAFMAEMAELVTEFTPKFDAATRKTFVTGHAALGYLARDFGLEQKSVEDVFASGEPTAKQLAELAEYCNANGIKIILAEEAASKAVSETLARECGAGISTIYTMERAEDGLGFVDRMRNNLETVLEALSTT